MKNGNLPIQLVVQTLGGAKMLQLRGKVISIGLFSDIPSVCAVFLAALSFALASLASPSNDP